MEKEGKINLKFLFVGLFLMILMMFFVFALDIKVTKPEAGEINTSTSRNINFTFTPTWDQPGEVLSNCSLWTNFTGTWQSEIEFNGSAILHVHNVSSNITNASLSWINYTFTHDIGFMVWDIGCYNNSQSSDAELTFNGSNRTLAIDTAAPKVVAGPTFYNLFNTTNETLTITINITDVNGTGVNLTSTANNLTLNFTLYNLPDTTSLKSYNLSNSSLYCIPSGDGLQSTQCKLNLTTFPLTNGTKNITISVTDRAGHTNVTWFKFTVDQIPPALQWINISNSPSDSNASKVINGSGSTRQGLTIYLTTNLTDNLTQPLNISFQFYNTSLGAWKVIDEQKAVPNGAGGSGQYYWGNASYTIPTGRNLFEGKNVSFRVVYNDTLGNSNNTDDISDTLIVQVNDTYAPTITINATDGGVAMVNGSNISNTRPLISWAVDENNKLQSINISVDGTLPSGTGIGDGCTKSAFYDTSVGIDNVESYRNGSFQINPTSIAGCSLGNGTHGINVTAIDIWGNSRKMFHEFVIETGEGMSLTLGLIESAVSTTNQSNITPYTKLFFNFTNGAVQKLANITWISSCYDGDNVFANNTYNNGTGTYPFNYSGCKGVEANWTVNLTATNTGGTSISAVYQFAVDDYIPPFVVHSPTEGLSASGLIELNVSAFDQMNRVDRVGFYLDGSNSLTNHSLNATALNVLLASYQGENVTYIGTSANFTAGTHTIKFSVNDSMGNVRNSTDITFTQIGPITFSEVNTSIESYIATVFNKNLTNVSIRIKTGAGTYADITAANNSNNTYEILYQIDGAINVSLTEINGSAANWDKINFTPYINKTDEEVHLQHNWTNTVLNSTWFNNSIAEFLPDNNSYYGVVVLPFNISSDTGLVQEFWWIENEGTLTTRTNISQCTAAFTRTTTTPCWNYTAGGKTIIQVPHFSIVVAVNDSDAPTINVTIPEANQTVSTFVPNITVSSDAKTCKYQLNSSSPSNVTMTKSGTVCLGTEQSFKNLETAIGYNVTFWVTDNSGNTNQYIWNFNVSDSTAPNSGTSITSSPSTTTAAVTITGVNESVNATVWYGTSVGSLTSSATETDFATLQSVSLSGLTASTMYHYNVTLRDYNGNTKRNGTFNFTTTAAAAAAAAAADGGAAGSGAAPVSNVLASKSQVWSSVSSGSSLALAVDKTNIAVTEVSISEVAKDLSNVELKVSSLKDNPVTDEAAGRVYQYLQITKANIQDEDAVEIKIKFRVTKTWLSDNGLTENDVALWRYKDNTWNMLDTTFVSSDATYVNYEAITPGFSYFAVGSKVAVSTLQAILDMIDSFYATGSPPLIEILDKIDSYYAGGA